MLLYHGTSSKHLKRIQKYGLKPRMKKKGNWEHTIQSRSDCVYLTSLYAPYFAASVCKKEPWMIVEVDSDRMEPFFFLPDEDFLEQATRSQEDFSNIGNTMQQRTKWFRDKLENFQQYWEQSIQALGNCCYQGIITPENITRIAIFDPKQDQRIAWQAMDPTITILNKFFCGTKYEELTAEIMSKYSVTLTEQEK